MERETSNVLRFESRAPRSYCVDEEPEPGQNGDLRLLPCKSHAFGRPMPPAPFSSRCEGQGCPCRPVLSPQAPPTDGHCAHPGTPQEFPPGSAVSVVFGGGDGGYSQLHKPTGGERVSRHAARGLISIKRNFVTIGIFLPFAVNPACVSIPVYLFNMSYRC